MTQTIAAIVIILVAVHGLCYIGWAIWGDE